MVYAKWTGEDPSGKRSAEAWQVLSVSSVLSVSEGEQPKSDSESKEADVIDSVFNCPDSPSG